MKYIGVDIGGTNTVVGIIDQNNKLIISRSFPTRAGRSAENLFDEINECARELCGQAKIDCKEIVCAGVACPGIISRGVCVSAHNLCFENTPLEAIAAERLKVPVFACNDANAAAYGEHIAGCGAGKSSLVMITIGTGIGGGIVLDNKLWQGFSGYGAELGHFTVEMNGRKCGCGSQGCLEAYCSATALINDTKAAMQNDKDSMMWKYAGGLEKVDGRTAFRCAEAGDISARNVIDAFESYLARGIINMIILLQPQIICIGGGMSREGEKLLEPLREKVNANPLAKIIGAETEIKAATLFGDAGLIGSAAWAKAQIKH